MRNIEECIKDLKDCSNIFKKVCGVKSEGESDYVELLETSAKYLEKLSKNTALTPLGILLRNLRLKNNELLIDMAKLLKIRPVEVSAIEQGVYKLSEESIELIVEKYNLNYQEIETLKELNSKNVKED